MEIVCRIESLANAGVKINDPGNPGKMYICGKSLTQFAYPNPRAAELLSVIRCGDEARMASMVDLLAKVFEQSGIETGLDAEAIIKQVAHRFGVHQGTVVLQERHVAQAFQEAIFEHVALEERVAKMAELFQAAPKVDPVDGVGIQAEIRTHLMKAGKAAFVHENFVTFEQAKELITELGGIVCYPVLADGMNPKSGFEADPQTLVGYLKDLDIHAAEFIPNRNQASVVSEYAEVMSDAGFVLSAGTEHNTTERIPIMPQCKGDVAIPDEALRLFIEGAHHQVRHQKEIAGGHHPWNP